jgi:anti-sigma factor RsiW
MNRSNLRLLPTPASESMPVLPPEEILRAESELAVAFEGLLARGERDEESPEYELLEAAVDGRLDPVAAELFASRLAGDPVLQREFDDLVALRDRLQVSPAARSVASSRSAARGWMGLAAAAVLLIAASLGFRQDLGPTPPPPAGVATAGIAASGTGAVDSLGVPQRPAEPLFADSFEGGTTDSWSN